MKKRIIKKHINALWRATCVWAGFDTVIKRAVEPVTGRYMRSLWYRFRAWRHIPEIGEAHFGDCGGSFRFRFNRRRKYVVEVTPYDHGFMRRAADTPTRRQVREWQREREELGSGARIW